MHWILRYVLTQGNYCANSSFKIWTKSYLTAHFHLMQFRERRRLSTKRACLIPDHMIPRHKTGRLLSCFLCGADNQVDEIRSIIQGITSDKGLDVVKAKEILRKNLVHSQYNKWAPEINRRLRWEAGEFQPKCYLSCSLFCSEWHSHDMQSSSASRYLDFAAVACLDRAQTVSSTISLRPRTKVTC